VPFDPFGPVLDLVLEITPAQHFQQGVNTRHPDPSIACRGHSY
jgi:hypothetical protein